MSKNKEQDISNERIIAKCVNSFGSSDHPYADAENIEGFDKDYVIECLCNALRWEKKRRENKRTVNNA